jgi:YVTN family beta-propeller protein
MGGEGGGLLSAKATVALRLRRPHRFAVRVGATLSVGLVALLLGSTLAAIHAPGSASAASTRAGPTASFTPPELIFRGTAPERPVTTAGASPGAVVSTLDLDSNRLLPGTTQPAVMDGPFWPVYDPVNGKLYVRSGYGDSVVVINASSDSVITEISLPTSSNPYSLAPTLAVDPATGNLLATSSSTTSLTIINGTTDQVAGSVPIGVAQNGILYDPADKEFYVSDYYSASVSVVSSAPYSWVTNVPTGTDPSALLFDPTSDQVFVANLDAGRVGGNVSIIDAKTNTLVKNLTTGAYPLALALDTHDDVVDVAFANGGSQSNVTEINATTDKVVRTWYTGDDTETLTYAPNADVVLAANGASDNLSIVNLSKGVLTTLPIGHGAIFSAYDATNGYVYVQNSQSANLSVVNPSSKTIVTNVSLANGLAYGLTVEPATGAVVALSQGSYTGAVRGTAANATIVSATTDRAVASIPLNVYPNGITYDPAVGNLIVANPGGGDVYELDHSSNLYTKIAAIGGYPKLSTYDPKNSTLWVIDPGTENVTVLDSTLRVVARVPVGLNPTGIAYDASDGLVYVTTDYLGYVAVINGTSYAVLPQILIHTSDYLTSALYDPHSKDVYVTDFTGHNVAVINSSGPIKSIPVGSSPLSLAFDSTNDTIFVANSGSNNISVIRDASNSVVGTIPLLDPGILAYDPANDLLYNAITEGGDVDVANATTYAVVGGLIYLGTSGAPSGIAYDPTNQLVYVSEQYANSISILSPKTAYSVYFNETGLATGTDWSVTLNGSELGSAGPSIQFTEPNATYPFSIGAVSGYVANLTSGNVVVQGGPTWVNITFTPVYPITFGETGLPQGTLWNVTLDGTKNYSVTPSIGFTEPAGSYSFTVGIVTGYVATPSSGMLPVTGPESPGIVFTMSAPGALSVTLRVQPSSITLGNSTTITASPTGGEAPLSYSYSDLPTGCTSADLAMFSCTPTVTGTFTIGVTVTDASKHTATASAELNVTSSPGPAKSSSTPGIPIWGWAAVAAGIAILLIIILLWRRRRKEEKAPVAPTARAPPPSAAPPPPATAPTGGPPK